MYHAVKSDFEKVKEIFYLHKKWFPHVRTDYMKRMIAKKNLILENDVVITYNFYKRKQKIGDIQAFKGDCILHQIVAKTKGTASDVLQRFFKFVNHNPLGKRVYLSVRSDNEMAKNFYLKNNMKLIGKTSWSKGTLPGDVFVYDPWTYET
jgi:RimJ/RimL family protein N-acetyltransferase|tara:strand:+ start:56 stop:505 length:450 start_codon:yes stop_codon:yes gene_type:complete